MKLAKFINYCGELIAIYKITYIVINSFNTATYIILCVALLISQININIIEYIEKEN